MPDVNRKKNEDYGSSPRKMSGMGTIGLYKRPKKKKPMAYSRQAPNYHANTDTAPGSGVGG